MFCYLKKNLQNGVHIASFGKIYTLKNMQKSYRNFSVSNIATQI